MVGAHLRELFGRVPDRRALNMAVRELAKGRRISLDQDVPVALVGDKWLICGGAVASSDRKPKDDGPTDERPPAESSEATRDG